MQCLVARLLYQLHQQRQQQQLCPWRLTLPNRNITNAALRHIPSMASLPQFRCLFDYLAYLIICALPATADIATL